MTPRATPDVTRAAHSSSSGVLIRRAAWRRDAGTGASASALMKACTSTVSFDASSAAAIAADVAPSVAVYI